MDNFNTNLGAALNASESLAALSSLPNNDLLKNIDSPTRKAVIEHGEFQSREELERFLYQRNEISDPIVQPNVKTF